MIVAVRKGHYHLQRLCALPVLLLVLVLHAGGAAGSRALAVGEDHTCVLRDEGRVYCWGRGADGRLGNDNAASDVGQASLQSLPFVPMPLADRASSLTAGAFMTCVGFPTGEHYCWGRNDAGQLATGDTAARGTGLLGETMADLVAIAFPDSVPVVQVSCGEDFVCGRFSQGGIRCWGGNSKFALGLNSNVTSLGSTRGELDSIGYLPFSDSAQSIAAGAGTACAVFSNGKLRCWGDNTYGQLGQDNTEPVGFDGGVAMSDLPYINLNLPFSAISLAVGSSRVCVVLSNTRVYCWGYDGGTGALGRNENLVAWGDDPARPVMDVKVVAFAGGLAAEEVTIGESHACALFVNKRIRCWGSSASGALGSDTTGPIGVAAGETSTIGFVTVGADPACADEAEIVAVDANGADHTCVMTTSGTIYCFGDNTYGQLGVGTADPHWGISPRLVPDVPPADLVRICSGTLQGLHTTTGLFHILPQATDATQRAIAFNLEAKEAVDIWSMRIPSPSGLGTCSLEIYTRAGGSDLSADLANAPSWTLFESVSLPRGGQLISVPFSSSLTLGASTTTGIALEGCVFGDLLSGESPAYGDTVSETAVLVAKAGRAFNPGFTGAADNVPRSPKVSFVHCVSTDLVAELAPVTLLLSEDAGVDQFAFRLNWQPVAELTVFVSSNDTSLIEIDDGSKQLVFSSCDYESSQAVTVLPIDQPEDTVVDPKTNLLFIVRSSEIMDDGLEVPSMPVQIVDNDQSFIFVSTNTLTVVEDGLEGTLTIVLSTEPTALVTVTAGDNADLALSATALVFSQVDWSQEQTITVTAVEDGIDELPDPDVHTIPLGVSSGDAIYNTPAVFEDTTITVNIIERQLVLDSVSPSPGNRFTSGVTVTLEGWNFINTTDPVVVYVDGEPGRCTVTQVNFAELICELAPTTGVPRLTVEVDGRVSSPISFPMNQPVITSVPMAPEMQATTLTIYGDEFGAGVHSTLRVITGGQDCLDAVVISINEIQCTSPLLSGRDLTVQVIVDSRSSVSTPVLSYFHVPWYVGEQSYFAPDLEFDVEDTASNPLVIAPEWVIVNVTTDEIVIDDIEYEYASPLAEIQDSWGVVPNVTLAAETRNVSWSHAGNLTYMPHPVVGTSLVMRIRLWYNGFQFHTNWKEVEFKMANIPRPIIRVLNPLLGTEQGGVKITLTGNWFGSSAANLTRVTMGDVPVAATWESRTRITFRSPVLDPGAVGFVVATSEGESVAPMTYNVQPVPVIEATVPQSTLALEPSDIGIVGYNFGVRQSDIASVTLAGIRCTSVTRVNDTYLNCRTGISPSGFVRGPVVVHSYPNGVTTTTLFREEFSFRVPTVDEVIPPFVSFAGGDVVTLLGSDFGLGVTNITSIFLLQNECVDIDWISTEEVHCTSTPHKLDGGCVTVSTIQGGEGVCSSNVNYTYPVPHVTSIVPSVYAVNGGIEVQIFGRGFDKDLNGNQYILDAEFGPGQSCSDEIIWNSATHLSCTLPPAAEPMTGPSRVSTPDGWGTSAVDFIYRRFTYPPPIIEGVYPHQVPIDGNLRVTIVGDYFGPTNHTETLVSVNAIPCTSPLWVSETRVSCILPSSRRMNVTTTTRILVSSKGQPTESTVPPLEWTDDPGRLCGGRCGYEGDCVDGSCVCRSGFFNAPACEDPQFLLTADIGNAIVTRDNNGRFTSEDGKRQEFYFVMQDQPGTSIVVQLGTEPAGEAVLSPTEVTFTSSNYASEVTVVATGLADNVRDGARTVTITADIMSGQAGFEVRGNDMTFTNRDSAPVIQSLSPLTLPINGTMLTIFGRNFDPEVSVRIGGIFVARDQTRVFSDDAPDDGSDYYPIDEGGRLRQTTLSGSARIEVRSPRIFTSGYQALEVFNQDGSVAYRAELVYYASRCVEEGQFFLIGSLQCLDCPEGAVCPGGIRLWCEEGFWNDGEDSQFIAPCFPPERCAGGNTCECSEGFTGRYCGSCTEGYYNWSGDCVECPAFYFQIIFWALSGAAWVVFWVLIWFAESDAVLTRIVWALMHVQRTGVIGKLVPPSAPRLPQWLYNGPLAVAGDLSFLRHECIVRLRQDHEFGVKVGFAVIVLLPVLLAPFIARPLVLYRARRMGAEVMRDTKKESNRRRYRMVSIFATLAVLPLLTLAWEYVSCYELANEGEWVLATLSHVECFADFYVPIAAGSAVISVAVLVWVFSYFHVINKLKNQLKLYDNEDFVGRWGFLYENMRVGWKNFWLLDYVIMAAIALSYGSLPRKPILQFTLCGGFLLVGAIVTAVFRPYRRLEDNILWAASYGSQFGVILLIFFMKTVAGPSAGYGLFVTFVGACAIFFAKIYYGFREFKHGAELELERQEKTTMMHDDDDSQFSQASLLSAAEEEAMKNLFGDLMNEGILEDIHALDESSSDWVKEIVGPDPTDFLGTGGTLEKVHIEDLPHVKPNRGKYRKEWGLNGKKFLRVGQTPVNPLWQAVAPEDESSSVSSTTSSGISLSSDTSDVSESTEPQIRKRRDVPSGRKRRAGGSRVRKKRVRPPPPPVVLTKAEKKQQEKEAKQKAKEEAKAKKEEAKASKKSEKKSGKADKKEEADPVPEVNDEAAASGDADKKSKKSKKSGKSSKSSKKSSKSGKSEPEPEPQASPEKSEKKSKKSKKSKKGKSEKVRV